MYCAVAFGGSYGSYSRVSEYPQTKRGGKDAGRRSVEENNFLRVFTFALECDMILINF